MGTEQVFHGYILLISFLHDTAGKEAGLAKLGPRYWHWHWHRQRLFGTLMIFSSERASGQTGWWAAIPYVIVYSVSYVGIHFDRVHNIHKAI